MARRESTRQESESSRQSQPKRSLDAPDPSSPIASSVGRIPKPKRKLRTPAEQRAEIERVAREHGADLSEEGFNEALRKVATKSVAGTD